MESIISAILNSNVDLLKNLLNNEIMGCFLCCAKFNVSVELNNIINVFFHEEFDGGNNNQSISTFKDQRREFVEFLLNNGADTIKTDKGLCKTGLRFFLFTCKYVSDSIVRLMIRYGPNLKCEDKWGLIQILKAFKAGEEEIYNFLLDKGVNASDINNLNLLHHYIGSNKATKDVLKKFLRLGANVMNATNELGESVLYLAAKAGNLEVVKLLIERKANVNYLGEGGSTDTALNGALSKGNREIVKYFLQQGANVTLGFPLFKAIETKNRELVKLILDHGADVSLSDGKRSPIAAAIYGGQEKIVELLLNRGAKPDNFTISLASRSRNPKFLKMFLDRGFDLNGIDNDGKFPLYYAVNNNSWKLVELLLVYGADVNVEFKGITALQKSIRIGINQPIIEILVGQVELIKSLDLLVSEKNLRAIKAVEKLVKFGERCDSELKLLKVEEFKESSLTCYDILGIGDANKLASLVNNENIVKRVESDEFKSKFPIYTDRILNQFVRGISINRDIAFFKRFIDYLSTRDHDQLPKLPFDVVTEILAYLNKNDIGNLRDL